MAISYGMISDCLGKVSQGYAGLCWNPTPWHNQYPGAFGFLVGGIFVALGAVMLVGPDISRMLRKLME